MPKLLGYAEMFCIESLPHPVSGFGVMQDADVM